MPEDDFEIFLSLLSQLLRLDPKQKAAISDELRDHLEERLAELYEEGVPRKEAVRKALEEFGDAAGLASQFTSLSQKRRRRILMRCTLATTAIAGLVFLAIVLFGPSNPDGPPRQIVAQEKEKVGPPELPKPAEPFSILPEKLLAESEVEFIDTPLKDALDFLEDAHKTKVILKENALQEEGVAIDEPINLKAKSPFYLILNRMLKPLGLAWYYEHEILFVTTQVVADENLSTKYYPAKPLLDLGLSELQIINLIEQETSGPWQNIDGTGGQALFLGQTLAVRQTFHVHVEVAAILEALKKLNQPGLLRLEPKEHEKLRHALASPTEVEFIDTPLRDVADFLSDSHKVPIVLDEGTLQEEGVAVDEPINFQLSGKTLQTTLELILEPLGLEAILQDGTILITTHITAEETLTTVIYNVKDIADSESAIGQLADEIQAVTKGPWQNIDGTGGNMFMLKSGTIVVRQTEPVHQEIEKLLETLRRNDIKLKPLPPEIITQIYRMSADTAEDLLTTLPEFVAAGTWQDEKNKTGPGTIRKVAAGQTFVKYPGAEESEQSKSKPKPEAKPAEKLMAEKAAEPQYIVVPQAVLIIRQTKEVHREIDRFLQAFLPWGTWSAGATLSDRPDIQPSGGGFF